MIWSVKHPFSQTANQIILFFVTLSLSSMGYEIPFQRWVHEFLFMAWLMGKWHALLSASLAQISLVVLLFFHLLDPIFYWDFMLPLCSYMYCFVDPVLWDNSIPRNLLSATYYIQHAGVVTVCVTLYIFCFCFLYYYYYYKFFVYFCVLFFFFCVFYSSNLTSCHATNVNQVFVFVLLAAKFLCDCSRFLTSYFYHKVDNG